MNTASIQNNKKNSRLLLFFLFLLAALVFAATLGWALFRFAFPQPEWIELGRLDDFPPAKEPYVIVNDIHVFLVNDGKSILVLDPLNRVSGGFKVNWNNQERVFIDPSRGSWFDLHGMPIRKAWINSPLESQSLARYEVKIEKGLVFIDLTRSHVIRVPG